MALAGSPDGEDRAGRWRRAAVPALLIVAVAIAIWFFAHQEAGVRREAPQISTIIPIEEPPPPPPPKVPPPPEPKPPDQVLPKPTPAPPTQAPPTPSPPSPNNNAVTQNAPAQAGSDAFNIGSGTGGGMNGSGGAGGGGGVDAMGYGQFAKSRILLAVRSDQELRGKSFLAHVNLWFDAQGRVTRVVFAKPTGTAAYDQELQRLLRDISGLPPPSTTVLAQMPIKFTIDERPSL